MRRISASLITYKPSSIITAETKSNIPPNTSYVNIKKFPGSSKETKFGVNAAAANQAAARLTNNPDKICLLADVIINLI